MSSGSTLQLQRKQVPAAAAHLSSLDDACMVDVKAVATILGRSTSSVWRDARNGLLPRPVRVGLRCTRWNVGAIRRYLASLGEVPA